MLSNALRGHLAELGIASAKGRNGTRSYQGLSIVGGETTRNGSCRSRPEAGGLQDGNTNRRAHDDLMQIPRSENRENPLSDGQRPVGEVEHREGGNDEACSGERRSHLDSRLSVRGLRTGM